MLLMGKSTISMAIFNSYVRLPEGKLLKMAVYSGFLPINSMVIFHSYVKLPEGNQH